LQTTNYQQPKKRAFDGSDPPTDPGPDERSRFGINAPVYRVMALMFWKRLSKTRTPSSARPPLDFTPSTFLFSLTSVLLRITVPFDSLPVKRKGLTPELRMVFS